VCVGVSGGSRLPLPRWTMDVEETTTSRACDWVRRCRRLWRLVHDLEIVKWTTTSTMRKTMSTTCVFVKSPSAMFVRERNSRFRSSRVSSSLLPSRRVFLASLCSCVGKFLFPMLRTHQHVGSEQVIKNGVIICIYSYIKDIITYHISSIIE
jgi:hypothetical protein